MKSKLLIYSLPALLVIIFMVYGYSTQDDPINDRAPVMYTDKIPSINPSISDTATPVGFPYQKLYGFVYNTIPGVSGGTVGACYMDGKFIMNRWNSAVLYRFLADGPGGGPGTLLDSNTAYNAGAGAIRDMTVGPDGSGRNFLWGGSASTVLYKMDSLGNRVASFTQPGAAYRTIAWDPNRKGFWSSNFTDNIVCRDTNGVVLKTIVNTAGGKYGLAFDSTSTADSAFLWVWSQNFNVPTDTTNDLIKVNIGTGATTATWNFNKGSNIAGGAEIFVKDNRLILSLNFQNYAVVGYNLKDLTPPPPVGNTLVLIHDSTITSTAQRKADRDTLNAYLPSLVGSYTIMNFISTTVLPDLSSYNTIILQETSFDVSGTIYLGPAARTSLKAWLSSGTGSSKKSLISIGGDQAYNYSRATSTSQDLEFAETYCKMTYRVDNGPGATGPTITGVGTDVGNVRPMTSTPAGANFWPDGASMIAGGSTALYKYQNHSGADTLAGIGNVQPGYVVASLFQDPRYFTGGFGAVLGATIQWVVSNGGVITGTGNNSVLTLPENYKLSQNYPNPFNPSTKINYSIPKSGIVTLKIYDILGKEVVTLVNELVSAGSHEVTFNASQLSSGTYFFRLESGNFVDTKKMLLLK